MNKKMKRMVAGAIAATLAITASGTVNVSDSDAAKKIKLSKSSVTVNVGKTKTVKIKNAKKVKKLTVKSSNKKVATVKKKGKKAFVVKGVKKGSAKVTAKVKVGSKTTKLNLKVKVKKATTTKKENNSDVTAAPSAAATAGASAAAQSPSASEAAQPTATAGTTSAAPTEAATEAPTPEPTETPKPYFENFEANFEDGDIGNWYARFDDEENGAAGLNTRLEILDNEPGVDGGKALVLRERNKGWNSITIDFSNEVVEGGSYQVTFSAKVPKDANDRVDTGFDLEEDGDFMKLRVSGGYKYEEDGDETYCNYPADTDYRIYGDHWETYTVDFTVPEAFYSYTFYFESNGLGNLDFAVDNVSIKRTAVPRSFDPSLPSIKEAYAKVGFDRVGTAVSYDMLLNKNNLGFVNHHYNSITLGNQMKPDAIITKETLAIPEEEKGNYKDVVEYAKSLGYYIPDDYASYDANKDAEGNLLIPKLDLKTVDKILKICADNKIGLRFHTLIWHQQMPKTFFTKQYEDDGNDKKHVENVVKDKATLVSREEMYIKTVLDHVMKSEYADVIYTIDVVNEFTHCRNEGGENVLNSHNWWKYAFGADFDPNSEYVKKAFVFAYDILKKYNKQDKVSLMFNEYSTYDPDTTSDIIKLITAINTKDDINPYGKICAGIGMQCHMNTGVTPQKLRTALDAFKAQDYEIQITELDMVNNGESDIAKKDASIAKAYYDAMDTFIKAKKDGAKISALVIWGLTDATSWLEGMRPLLFGTDVSDVKEAFYKVIQAAEDNAK